MLDIIRLGIQLIVRHVHTGHFPAPIIRHVLAAMPGSIQAAVMDHVLIVSQGIFLHPGLLIVRFAYLANIHHWTALPIVHSAKPVPFQMHLEL
jgi:hypothetical protein